MELTPKGIKQTIESLPAIADIYPLSSDFHLVVHQVFEEGKKYQGTVCDIKQVKAQVIYRIKKTETGFMVRITNAENFDVIEYDLTSTTVLDSIVEVILSIKL